MRRVIIESPYAGDVERNVRYARACVRHSLILGESPFASHLLHTQPGVLDDQDAAQRKLGIEAGLAWGTVADATIVYDDLGVSSGMEQGIKRAIMEGRKIEYRHLGGEWEQPNTLHEAIDYLREV